MEPTATAEAVVRLTDGRLALVARRREGAGYVDELVLLEPAAGELELELEELLVA